MRIGMRAAGVEAIIRRLLVGTSGKAPPSVDALEPRCLLAGTPLPSLTDLENANNAVVRFETTMGDIDLELFSSQAPITVANFLNYVTTGRYDNTIFHRNAINPNPFVLQGGGFGFEDGQGLVPMATDAPIVRETTGRQNIARTIAMARTGAINSATNQFFINYVTNSFLDPTAPTNGYAVFGRVIQGWDVVVSIQNLRSLNLTGNASFSGSVHAGAMNEFPVTNTYVEGQPIAEAHTIRIINAEIIKPTNVNGFFEQRLIMPEGFRSARTTETLDLYNPNTTTATYQVIVKYEWGLRDTVVYSGAISAGSKLRLRLSDAGDSSLNAVRANTPYSVIVETALPNGTPGPQPITGSVNRVDFNADTSEGMFNPAGYSDTQLRTWDFGRMERGPTSREYISWVSLDDTAGNVTVTMISASGSQSVTYSLDAYRRGGIAMHGRNLAAGTYSVRVTSTVPIVAYLSDWDIPATGQAYATSYTPAFGVMGLPGGGAAKGGAADVVVRTNFTSTLSIFNPGNTVASVTLNFWRTGRISTDPPISRLQSVNPQARVDFDLAAAALGIPLGESFSVTYTSSSASVSIQYTSFDNVGRNLSGTKKADGVASMLAARVAPTAYFTDGLIDPTRTDGSQTERISIFNPFADAGQTFTYTIRYYFSDGTSIDAFSGTLGANARVDHTTQSSSAVRNKASSNGAFRNYAIAVLASANDGETTTTVSGIVQLTRIDTTTGLSITTTGSASGFGYPYTDPIFLPPT
ncbi:MAG: hypothetical protein HBSAPP03_09230 [Phycisphaerae bacterium]|nr:MAG: hypothetical protein HBSAPP03_09230 [Phycisphaerae bacterium]